ncbi:MAG TPA: secretin N-terminal domain-containing protein, partial [Pirellulales bacterium]|nr:secretin N-terminal domain-containing protein [Pirellulales bacterium]
MHRSLRFRSFLFGGCLFVAAAALIATANAQGPPGAAPVEVKRKMPPPDGGKPEAAKPDDAQKPGAEKPEGNEKPGEKEPGKPEGPPPVQRPAQPPRPADPKELEVRPNDDGKISFSFKGQPWPAVLEWLADISQMSLQWEEVPGGFLDLTTRGQYTVDEVRDLVNSVLLAKGFTLLRNGEVLIVANLKKLDASLVPRVTSRELDRRGAHELVKAFFDLDWLVAENAAEEFKPLLSPFGKITALKATNRLDALDTAGNLRRIRELLAEEQSGSGQQRLVQEFRLRHTRAPEVLETLNTLLGLETKKDDASVDPRQAMRMQQQMMMMAQQGGMPQMPAAKKETSVYLAVNQRKNSIMANAPPDKMGVIEQAIKAIDVPQADGERLLDNVQRMQIYRLSGVSPDALIKVLKELGGLDPTTKLEIDPKKGALIVYAPLVDHVLIQSLVSKLDGSGRKFKVIPLRTLNAEYVAGSIIALLQGPEKTENNSRGRYYPFFFDDFSRQNKEETPDKFWVEADVERNRLLLRANDVELTQVEALLTELGEIPLGERNPNTMRVVPAARGEETDRFLKRLQRLWPTVSPNPLQLEGAGDEDLDDEDGTTAPKPRRRASGGKSAGTPEAPRERRGDDRATGLRNERAHDPRYRLAQDLRSSTSDEGRADPEGASDEETSNDDGVADDAVSDDEAADDEAADDEAADGEGADDEGVSDDRGAGEERRFDDRARGRGPGNGGLPRVSRAPVKITVGPQGLVISSSDTEALDRLEEMLLAGVASARSSYKIFMLKHTYAKDVVSLLKDIYKDESDKSNSKLEAFDMFWNGGSRNPPKSRTSLGKRRPLSFVADAVTNTILVQGADAAQLEEIESLIRSYDTAEAPNAESVRRTSRVKLRYAKAKEVAELVKDVYRDLLSPNDKALQGNMPPQQQQQQKPQSENFMLGMMSYLTDDPTKSASVPRFKGLLSVGVDERANGVVISAPQVVLIEVLAMVKQLDTDAKTTRGVIRVRKLGDGGIAKLLEQVIAPKKTEAPAAAAPPGNGNAPP